MVGKVETISSVEEKHEWKWEKLSRRVGQSRPHSTLPLGGQLASGEGHGAREIRRNRGNGDPAWSGSAAGGSKCSRHGEFATRPGEDRSGSCLRPRGKGKR